MTAMDAIAAHARGLGTCWVGSPLLWLNDAEVKTELAIPPDHTPYAAFTLGHPNTTPPASRREPPMIMWV